MDLYAAYALVSWAERSTKGPNMFQSLLTFVSSFFVKPTSVDAAIQDLTKAATALKAVQSIHLDVAAAHQDAAEIATAAGAAALSEAQRAGAIHANLTALLTPAQ